MNEQMNEWRWPWYLEVLSMHKVVMQRRQAANRQYAKANFFLVINMAANQYSHYEQPEGY